MTSISFTHSNKENIPWNSKPFDDATFLKKEDNLSQETYKEIGTYIETLSTNPNN